jgi:hypothetical protein
MDPYKPTLRISKNTDVDNKEAENEQNKMEFKAEYNAYM